MPIKIMTILGCRPELIRLSRIIPKLDQICNHILVHTGQNYNPLLKDIFFSELKIREPNYYLSIDNQLPLWLKIGTMLNQIEKILIQEKPDKVVILGDTYSGLSAIVAKRMRIPIGHLEAGNRCFNEETPEENNRHIIDICSTLNFPYTYRSRNNLIREGFNSNYIFVTGNPIFEVIQYYNSSIINSQILSTLNLKPKKYILVTLHRSENVDNSERFKQILGGLNLIANTGIKLIISTHPRTRNKLENNYAKLNDIISNDNIKFLEPFKFFDFITLEKNAQTILTDSGTVQEEACILKIPCVIIRKSTERTETIECGASILAGVETENIYTSYKLAIKMDTNWIPPIEYLDLNVSNKIINHFLNSWEYK